MIILQLKPVYEISIIGKQGCAYQNHNNYKGDFDNPENMGYYENFFHMRPKGTSKVYRPLSGVDGKQGVAAVYCLLNIFLLKCFRFVFFGIYEFKRLHQFCVDSPISGLMHMESCLNALCMSIVGTIATFNDINIEQIEVLRYKPLL